jgi:hypothetical protein
LTKRAGPPDQILGARVMLTAWIEASESELTQALEQISGPISLTPGVLPLVVLERSSREKAEWARDLLVRAGGTVSVEEVWVTREEAGDLHSRPACPSCGSGHTQPFRMPDPPRE